MSESLKILINQHGLENYLGEELLGNLHIPSGGQLNNFADMYNSFLNNFHGGSDQNLMKVHELLNKHAEARKKIGYMAKNNYKEMNMDAHSILQRAPKLIINNIDSVNQILPKEKVYINAFGVVDDMNNFNVIPPEMYKALDNLQNNEQFLLNLVNGQQPNGTTNDVLQVQRQILQTLLMHQQHEQLSHLVTNFGAKNKVKENMISGSMPALVVDCKKSS